MQPEGAVRAMPDDALRINLDQVTPEGTSILDKMIEEAMQETKDLQDKWEQSEKEKNDLQFKVNMLKAENHPTLSELQNDIFRLKESLAELKHEIARQDLKISEKDDVIKKMKESNKTIWNIVTQLAPRLEKAGLLTAKDKKKMKKFVKIYGEENHISVDTFDSEGSSCLPTSSGIIEDVIEDPHVSDDCLDVTVNEKCTEH